MTTFLKAQNISFSFPARTVLEDISFEADEGEFIALMGCNGAGKSTLMDLLVRLREPSQGQILLCGERIFEWPYDRLSREVSHLPQSVRTDLPYSVEQLVLMGRYPHRTSWFDSSEDLEAAKVAMQRTSCWQDRRRRFFTLSGGERQRVLLAACLAQQARLLLWDEPSVFLDIDQQLSCFQLLKEEAADGKLCIAVTHDINLALTYCSRLLVISNHRLVVDIATREAQQRTGWLGFLSPRLELGTGPNGNPWVWYQ
jgi:ABC-type cobalamin/Fe3+-siderophores transport system ATPase subunit